MDANAAAVVRSRACVLLTSMCERTEMPGSAPDARHYFLLSCQKKVSKEKAHPLCRPAAPGALRCSVARGGCGTRACGPQTVLALFPLAPCAARRRRGQLENRLAFSRMLVQSASGFDSPSCSAEQRRKAGGSRRALFEGRSLELRSRPAFRVAQGSRRSRPRNAGVAFSLATFFWRSKRKYVRASGAEPGISASPLTHQASPC